MADFKKLPTVNGVDVSLVTHNHSDLSSATSANTANTLVKRDASGNFSVGTITGALTGNAGTATKLVTARTLTLGATGKTFDGSANVAWSLAEIGAASTTHVHTGESITSGTINAARLPQGLNNAIWVKNAADLQPDPNSFGVTFNQVFGLLNALSFSPLEQGVVWLQVPVNATWSANNVPLTLWYTLDRVDNSKNVRVITDVWVINAGDAPSSSSPTYTGVDLIASSANNTNKLASVTLINSYIPTGFTANSIILIRLTRDAEHIGDTYSGLLSLIKLSISQ